MVKLDRKIIFLTKNFFSEADYFGSWPPVKQFEISVFGRNPIISVFNA